MKTHIDNVYNQILFSELIEEFPNFKKPFNKAIQDKKFDLLGNYSYAGEQVIFFGTFRYKDIPNIDWHLCFNIDKKTLYVICGDFERNLIKVKNCNNILKIGRNWLNYINDELKKYQNP